jgi:hypothetical protein|eukprot:TRINITY_DN74147_c0_g1_i1.p1 TRINITY_DN74147_c0_g1~~TRINITY_DN74147_c0_g1_i1.p1  ORF type:complete len:251 (+),score=48.27 TRINITY_DN74147_c0_g1_i1:69-821(+)
MEPVTLHFNVFQVGANSEGRRTVSIEDPSAVTVRSLKLQFFADSLKEQKTVRFITGGRMLDDKATVAQCKLGLEAHIHVSISDAALGGAATPAQPEGNKHNSEAIESRKNNEENRVGFGFMLGFAFFAGSGALLRIGWQKRLQLSMQTNQFVFILGAVWAFLLLFHGIPALFQVFMQNFNGLSRSADVIQVTEGGASTIIGSGASPSVGSGSAALAGAATAGLGGAVAAALTETHGAARARSIPSTSLEI